MEKNGQDEITLETRIYIFPGYKFHICEGLITNFHLPKSTLLLLVSAFIGDNWQKVYEEALKNGYRFLSYGDVSLLIP
jgi:S-adenosylmethionine:tRNA ribosyltransferase-isomerase